MPLNLQPHFAEPGQRYFRDFTPGDDFYEALIETHRGLSDAQSELVNAKLVGAARGLAACPPGRRARSSRCLNPFPHRITP